MTGRLDFDVHMEKKSFESIEIGIKLEIDTQNEAKETREWDFFFFVVFCWDFVAFCEILLQIFDLVLLL